MSGTVWAKFYWSDWANDPALRLCSLAAQGLWMRVLCVAAEADPTGYVTVNGRPLGVTDIARLAGVTETECESLLAELDRNGVFSRTRTGTIYSRRMVRDAKRVKNSRENGKKGGNPSLSKINGISGRDNPPVKSGVNTHMPEANSHMPESSSARAGEPITNIHRMMAADLLDRGKANLSSWERKFLEDICSKSVLTAKMQGTLNGISAKIGLTADTVMATWRKRLDAARRMRQWDAKWGPPPRALGCIVPDELLQPDDGNGWSEWRAAS